MNLRASGVSVGGGGYVGVGWGGYFCTDGFKQIAPCTVKPSISRLETREVYSRSSAQLSLKHTAHQHKVTLIDKSS